MYYGLNYVPFPQIHMLKLQPPNVTTFGDKIFKEVNENEALGCEALIQYD